MYVRRRVCVIASKQAQTDAGALARDSFHWHPHHYFPNIITMGVQEKERDALPGTIALTHRSVAPNHFLACKGYGCVSIWQLKVGSRP